MRVTVHYLAQLKQAVGVPSEVIDAPPGTLYDLIRHIADRHGEPLRRLLFDASGAIQPTNLLFLNDEQIQQPASKTLKDGDGVMLLSPIAGG